MNPHRYHRHHHGRERDSIWNQKLGHGNMDRFEPQWEFFVVCHVAMASCCSRKFFWAARSTATYWRQQKFKDTLSGESTLVRFEIVSDMIDDDNWSASRIGAQQSSFPPRLHYFPTMLMLMLILCHGQSLWFVHLSTSTVSWVSSVYFFYSSVFNHCCFFFHSASLAKFS